MNVYNFRERSKAEESIGRLMLWGPRRLAMGWPRSLYLALYLVLMRNCSFWFCLLFATGALGYFYWSIAGQFNLNRLNLRTNLFKIISLVII